MTNQEIELTKKQQEKFSHLIIEFLTEHNIKINPDWENDFSKEHDFFSLVLEVEKYLTEVNNYKNEVQ